MNPRAMVCERCRTFDVPANKTSGVGWTVAILGVLAAIFLGVIGWIAGPIMLLIGFGGCHTKICGACGAEDLLPQGTPRAQELIATGAAPPHARPSRKMTKNQTAILAVGVLAVAALSAIAVHNDQQRRDVQPVASDITPVEFPWSAKLQGTDGSWIMNASDLFDCEQAALDAAHHGAWPGRKFAESLKVCLLIREGGMYQYCRRWREQQSKGNWVTGRCGDGAPRTPEACNVVKDANNSACEGIR